MDNSDTIIIVIEDEAGDVKIVTLTADADAVLVAGQLVINERAGWTYNAAGMCCN